MSGVDVFFLVVLRAMIRCDDHVSKRQGGGSSQTYECLSSGRRCPTHSVCGCRVEASSILRALEIRFQKPESYTAMGGYQALLTPSRRCGPLLPERFNDVDVGLIWCPRSSGICPKRFLPKLFRVSGGDGDL